jgi:hypothetical protein
VRRLLMLTLLCLVGVFVLAPNAFAQGSFCTTSAGATGERVTKCVDAPSPTAAASPDVTVIGGGPLTPSPTATSAPTAIATASGTAFSSAVKAVGGILPPTGGGGLALIAAALLLGSGAMSFVILRRR